LKKQPKKSFLICVQQLVWTPNWWDGWGMWHALR
jgi:hypothetical protein